MDKAIDILEYWGASNEQIQTILAKKVQTRAEKIVFIYDTLAILFSNPENQKKFMTMVNYNTPFNGLTPLSYLTENPDRIGIVFNHLRAMALSPW